MAENLRGEVVGKTQLAKGDAACHEEKEKQKTGILLV